jgi:hypothetical protein
VILLRTARRFLARFRITDQATRHAQAAARAQARKMCTTL